MRVFDGFLKAMKRRMKVRKSMEIRFLMPFLMVFWVLKSILKDLFAFFLLFWGFFGLFLWFLMEKMVKNGEKRGYKDVFLAILCVFPVVVKIGLFGGSLWTLFLGVFWCFGVYWGIELIESID